MEKKNKVLDITTIFCICGTILVIIVSLGIRIYNVNTGKMFVHRVKAVYTLINKQYQEDIKNESLNKEDLKVYQSKSIFKDGEELNYIANFDLETNKITHFCASNGKQKIEFDGNQNIDNIDETAIISDIKECTVSEE